MRSLILLLLFSAVASADQTVVVQSPSTVIVVPAQEHAEYLARRNLFGHCSRRGHGHEGIGFSTVSPDAACKTACYWGRLRVREIGTAWCPARRGWIAVVRYE